MATKTTQETIKNLYSNGSEQLEGSIKSGRDQFETAMKTGTEQLESFMRTGAQTAQKSFEQGVEAAKKQLDEVIRGYDELASVGRENVGACLAASSATAKAVETVNTELFAFSKKSYENQISAFRALSGAKTPKEFFDIQSDLMKGQYEDLVAEANKVNSVVAAAATDAFAPVNARFVAAFDSLSRAFTR